MEEKNEKNKSCLFLTDAHAHLGSGAEREERLQQGIPTLICAGTVEEAKQLYDLQRLSKFSQVLIPAYGLHPWHAQEDWNDMKPYMESGRIVGEIGMDSLWCQTPLTRQREVFEAQLEFAAEKKKPVVLHTKGQEKTIVDLIRCYPNRYLVHWYSAEEYLEEYLDLDCYCSVGPDVWWNPAVRKLAAMVSDDRILIETDGMGAVEWAYQEGMAAKAFSQMIPVPVTVKEALGNTLEILAKIRGVDCSRLAEQVGVNFNRFCGFAVRFI